MLTVRYWHQGLARKEAMAREKQVLLLHNQHHPPCLTPCLLMGSEPRRCGKRRSASAQRRSVCYRKHGCVFSLALEVVVMIAMRLFSDLFLSSQEAEEERRRADTASANKQLRLLEVGVGESKSPGVRAVSMLDCSNGHRSASCRRRRKSGSCRRRPTASQRRPQP